MSRRTTSASIAALLLAAVVMTLPVGAHPVAHPAGPRIVNPLPAPGGVVAPGTVQIAALAVSGADIVEHRMTVDGREVTATRAGPASHPTLAANASVTEGDHIVSVAVTDASGRTAERAWRFTASGPDILRLAGDGRVETAVAVSQNLYPAAQSADAALIARADDFADALAGVPLAHAVDGPLLLSASDQLSPAAGDELERLLPAGATVYLLGASSALSERVAQDVMARGLVPRRLAGASRYHTAAAVGAELPPADVAVVVSGQTFADALSVSSPAAIAGWPILLTQTDALPDPTRQALEEREVTDIIVVGGTSAVSESVVAELRGIATVTSVERIAGPGRFDTAAAVADRFFDSAPTVAVASGERFPDALAGGRHAAAIGAPLLLSGTDRLLRPQYDQVAAHQPSQAVVYGGTGAVSEHAAQDLRRARADRFGPRLTSIRPVPGSEVHTLDQIVVEFDRPVQVLHSTIYVTIDGHEVPGGLQQGEFDNSIVFTAAELPVGVISPGVRYELEVTGSSTDGIGWRHFVAAYTYQKLDLSRGDSGELVRDLQQQLTDHGYWVGPVDGAYGNLTHQAVMAFQKVHGLTRDGVYGPATRALLESNPPRATPRSSSGLWYEIDLTRQVVMRVVDGHVQWVFNASSGHGQVYEFQGQTFRATTTTGQLRVTRQIDGLREAERGLLWRPKYFDSSRGIALHGSTSVPAYPASAGCVRVSYAAMDFIWSLDPDIGQRVWVYPEDFYR